VQRFIYVSHAPDGTNSSTLQDIFTVARKRNRDDDLTGVLLWTKGVFLQLLEGPKVELDMAISRISADSRHSDLTRLVYRKVDHITCGNWDMGCFPVHPSSLEFAFLDTSDVPTIIQKFQETPDREFDAFFKNFYKNNSDKIHPRRKTGRDALS